MTLFNYENQANQPGIYFIYNLLKKRVYVGQAQLFKTRWADHMKSLRSGKHSNKFLQTDFNLCGEIAFEFRVLEVMPGSTKPERKQKEDSWISVYYDGQKQCYNFMKTASALPRSCYSKTPKITSKLISENMKKIWQDPILKGKRLETARTAAFIEKQRAKRNEIIGLFGEQDPSSVGTRASWQDSKKRKSRIEKIKNHPTSFKEGQVAWNKGMPPSEETRQKISAKLTGKSTCWLGRKHSDETKKKISLAKKGKKHSMQKAAEGSFLALQPQEHPGRLHK